jgi:hypothetical protein
VRRRRNGRAAWSLLGALALACGSRSGLLAGGEKPTFGHAGSQASGGTGTVAGGQNLGGKPPHAGNANGGKPNEPPFSGAPNAAGEPPLFGGTGGAGGQSMGGESGLGGEPQSAGAGGERPVTDVVWGRNFGDASPEQEARAIAVEPNGDFTLTGALFGNVDFGDGARASLDDQSAFVAQFDTNAAPRWSAVYGGPGTQTGLSIAVAADGALSVVGSFSGTVDFGGGTLQGGGNADAFVAGFEHDGKYRFAKGFGDNGNQAASGVTVTSTGDALVAGYFVSSIDLGGGKLSATGVDAWLASFGPQGAYQRGQQAGAALAQRANGIAHSAFDDSAFVVGDLMGQLKLDACSTLVAQGSTDVWLGWLDSSGNCLRSLRFGEKNHEQFGRAVAASKGASNLLAIVGLFNGNIDIGGSSVQAEGSDAFVALFQAEPGAAKLFPVWVRRIGGVGFYAARAVTFDADDDVIVAGDYLAQDVWGDLSASPDHNAAFAVKYDTLGNVVWAKSFAGSGDQVGNAVGADQQGYVYVAGSLQGDMPLSTGTLKSAGADDIFVVKLAP